MDNIWQSNNLKALKKIKSLPYNSNIMFMGTGSDVGKSLIVAGFCRLFAKLDIAVAPFKPQNMSNNAAIATIYDLKGKNPINEMGEIGRAQWLQAKACNIKPVTHMNPILLKPENEIGSQVIINGQKFKSLKARDYYQYKPKFLTVIKQCFEALNNQYELVIVEGAGSPAESNLRKNDIANMGFAEQVDVGVILIGDIDRGGVIASIIGTYEILSKADRARIKGFMINKFRGDASLFDEAIEQIERHTGWKSIGILPYFKQAHLLPAEDSMALSELSNDPQKTDNLVAKKLQIIVPKLPHIANFDDLDPLLQHENVTLRMISQGQPLPNDADLIILPGSKSTIADLQFLYEQGWDVDIKSHIRQGGSVLGICGGFQMLGHKIEDLELLEGCLSEIKGLGLLDVETKIAGEKSTKLVEVEDLQGNHVAAYEIHLGQTIGEGLKRPMFRTDQREIGACSTDGRVMGSYLHGIFANNDFREAFLAKFNIKKSSLNYDQNIESVLDGLAEHIAEHLDLKAVMKILEVP